jgi:acetyl-CoA C-acetyltransferase
MNNKLNEVVIVAAARTPIGSYKGSLKDIKADKLGSLVIEEVINRSGIDKKEVSEVIMGQVFNCWCRTKSCKTSCN